MGDTLGVWLRSRLSGAMTAGVSTGWYEVAEGGALTPLFEAVVSQYRNG